jgi:hypothetical protein
MMGSDHKFSSMIKLLVTRRGEPGSGSSGEGGQDRTTAAVRASHAVSTMASADHVAARKDYIEATPRGGHMAR